MRCLESTDIFPRIHRLLDQMEEAQKRKVIDLARRIRPGLTPEDIRNPHDFPDLDDPDWHFEDGQLTGIQAVRFAMSNLQRELLTDGQAGEEDQGDRTQGEGSQA